jgi:cell division protein FtsL
MTSTPPSFVARGASPSVIRRAVDRRGLAVFASAMAAALLLGGVMLFAIWARTRVTAAGYALDQAVRQHQELTRRHEALTLEAAKLKSSVRLEQLARKLGMGPAKSDRTVVLYAGPAGSAQALPDKPRAVVAAHR